MAFNRMSLLDLIHKSGVKGDMDFLREGLKVLAEAIMELEVSSMTGAERYERSAERTTYRNGYREREWDTRVGSLDLRIPKLRDGSYFPSILEPRKKAEKALAAVLQEAYVLGVSTRKVDDLMKALGLTGVSKSEVSRVCAWRWWWPWVSAPPGSVRFLGTTWDQAKTVHSGSAFCAAC
jgi:putative transposase